MRAPAPLPQSKSVFNSFPTSKTPFPTESRKENEWVVVGECLCALPVRHCLGTLGSTWSLLLPLLALGCGPECRVLFAVGRVLPPSPQRLPHFSLLPGRFFRWKPALPRPTLIKLGGRAGNSSRLKLHLSAVPHLLFPPSLAKPGKAAGARSWQEVEWGPALAQPSCFPSFIQTGKQGASAGGDCPSACEPGTQ